MHIFVEPVTNIKFYTAYSYVIILLALVYLHFVIKTHDRESRGQEEVAICDH